MRDWVVGGAVIERRALVGAGGGALVGADGAALGAAGGRAVDLDADDGGLDRVLLVENVRRNGVSDWTPPGGVIDPGEDLLVGLTREVREETGLEVLRWAGPLYEIRAEAPDLGWRLRVEVHMAAVVEGEVSIGADPDGIVVDADWFGASSCEDRLGASHPWVREPLLEWMLERFDATREFRYEVLGTGVSDARVTRL